MTELRFVFSNLTIVFKVDCIQSNKILCDPMFLICFMLTVEIGLLLMTRLSKIIHFSADFITSYDPKQHFTTVFKQSICNG